MKQKLKFTWFLFYLCLYTPLFLYSDNQGQSSFQKAEKLYFEKNFLLAEQFLIQVIYNNPSHFKALALLGDIYFFKKKYKKAIDYYERSIEVSPSPSNEEFRLGQVYLALKNPNKAKLSFEKAYQINPNLTTCLFQLGYIELLYNRNKEQTIILWETFLEQSPHDPQYQNVYKAIQLLKDPNFKLPPKDSNISIEEALLLGGKLLNSDKAKVEDKHAGDAKLKENNQIKGLIEDDEL